MAAAKKKGAHKFQKGHAPHPKAGRPAGVPNKVSRDVKESIINVYNMLGGDAGLRTWAMKERNKKEFYKIWAKLLPVQMRITEDPNRPPQPPTLQMIFLGDGPPPPEALPPIDVTPE